MERTRRSQAPGRKRANRRKNTQVQQQNWQIHSDERLYGSLGIRAIPCSKVVKEGNRERDPECPCTESPAGH